MNYVKSFRDLQVYLLARQLAREVFELSKGFPKEEMFSITSQVRRSSRSIGAQIAEGWAKRRFEKHFVSKLTDADAEQLETQHWIETILDCSYCTSEQAERLLIQCVSVGKMLNSMINKSNLFCQADAR